jgi:hypothetical protein
VLHSVNGVHRKPLHRHCRALCGTKVTVESNQIFSVSSVSQDSAFGTCEFQCRKTVAVEVMLTEAVI